MINDQEHSRVLGLGVSFSWQNRQFKLFMGTVSIFSRSERSSFGFARVSYFLGLQHVLFRKWWRCHSVTRVLCCILEMYTKASLGGSTTKYTVTNVSNTFHRDIQLTAALFMVSLKMPFFSFIPRSLTWFHKYLSKPDYLQPHDLAHLCHLPS